MTTRPQNADLEWLVGLRAIGAYLGRSGRTIRRWIDREGFPAGLMPDGRWMASKIAIRDWVAVRGQLYIEQRRRSECPASVSRVGDHGSPPTTA